MEKSIAFKEPQLEEVRDQFEEWRRSRKSRRDPIPLRLWKAAVNLSGSYSIHSISKALRLNYSDLKERVDQQLVADRVKALPAAGFIDLGCSQSLIESECIIEMQNAGGLKMQMRVRGKVDFNLLQLAKVFLAKGT